jgi:hypothetical protein
MIPRSFVIPRRSRRSHRITYDGRLQAVVNGKAIGWAWDPQDRARHVEVGIEIDEQVVVSGVADIFRDELVDAGVGDGSHGFLLELPEELRSRDSIRVVALAGPEQLRLPDSPNFWFDASEKGSWRAVRFSSGRAADPELSDDATVEVPAAPESAPLWTLVGRNGWLYDAAELQVARPASDDQLDAAAKAIEDIAGECAAFGVTYVAALVPDKLSAIPEGAPEGIGMSGAWARRIAAWLRDVDAVDVLDLLPVLQDAGVHGACFHRSDPFWNDRGAFFVARALLKEAAKRAPALRPLPLEGLYLTADDAHRGALADAPKVAWDGERTVVCEHTFAKESGCFVDVSRLHTERLPVERHLIGANAHVRLHGKADGTLRPRLSVVGGAACLPLLPWLSESAERTSFFWAVWPPLEPIELELPDALLHLIGQTDLAALAAGQSNTP